MDKERDVPLFTTVSKNAAAPHLTKRNVDVQGSEHDLLAPPHG